MNVRVLGGARFSSGDLYHLVLRLPWSGYLGGMLAFYVLANVAFATAYRASPGCISGIDDFEHAFYFSVQTMTTIGYGQFAPTTRAGHVLVTLEALVGVLAMTMITSLTFARFTRPVARVLFSRWVALAPRNGVPHLMFRLANARHNAVVEAELRVTLLVSEVTAEGESLRRQIEVPLVRPRTTLFALSWTAMHRVDASSPFHGEGALERLRAQDAELVLSMSGLDETIAQTIHARHRYTIADVAENARFHDVIRVDPDGVRVIDYAGFHEVVPVTSKGEA